MKRCPACRRVYPDEALKFCAKDGATLVNDDSADAATLNLSSEVGAEGATRILRGDDARAATQVLDVHLTEGATTGRLTTGRLKPTDGAKSGGSRRGIVVVLLALLVAGAAAAGFYFYRHASDTEVAIESIAVLPFANQSQDQETEYLSDGLTESIINSLAQLPNLRVVPRSSVFRYKGQETDPLAAGRQLGVRAVLVGRVLQRADGLQVSAELVDVRENKQIWGDRFNRKLSDLLPLQQEISRRISERLKLSLTSEDERRVARNYTADTEAYQLYLRGRYHWNKRTAEDLKTATGLFQKAIDKDANYALAYAGLADTYNILSSYGVAPPREAYPKGKAAAERALAIDDTLAEAHTALAVSLSAHDWNWRDAEGEFKRAIELNPNYSTAHYFYSYSLLTPQGRHEEAVAEMKRAQELEPLSLIINTNLGWALNYAGRYGEAEEHLRRTLELEPNFGPIHARLADALTGAGRHEEAIREAVLARERRGSSATGSLMASLGYAYAAGGKRAEAKRMLAEIKTISAQSYVSAFWTAKIHAALGEKEEAFKYLQRAYEDRDFLLPRIKVEPGFQDMRSDPRFADFVRKVNLQP